jgi:hypothetical protein
VGKVEYTYVGTQQVVENNYNFMQLIISNLKAESILYVRFIDTLATYLLCEVETTKTQLIH